MSIKGLTKRISGSFKRHSREDPPVGDQVTITVPHNGYLTPEELEGVDSVPEELVQGSRSLRRVQSSKTTRTYVAPQSEANRYSLPTTYIEMQRPKSSDGRRSGGGLGLSDMNSSGARLKNGPDPPRPLSRTVSASAVSTLEASSQTSLLSSASTNSLVSGKTMYMPSASRRQRRSSLNEIGYGREKTYQKLEKLGEGTYATVFKGISTITKEYVALKEIRLEYEEGAPCTAIREVSLLKDLKHANIVCLHDIIHTNRSLTLVFEYVDQDLKQYLDRCHGIMSVTNARLFLFQLLRGLDYCHKRKVLHRDLKPQNLLIGENGDLKLADFGLARAKSVPTKTYSNEVVTLWYRPPDVLLGSVEYNSEIDMWGVGCIFYEMLNGKPMFPGSSVEEELELIFKYLGTPTEDSWPGITTNEDFVSFNIPYYPPVPLGKLLPRLDGVGIDLMYKFLCYNAKNRLQAEPAMHHPFFECLGKRVFDIHNTMSIFALPECCLANNPVQKEQSSKRDRRKSAMN